MFVQLLKSNKHFLLGLAIQFVRLPRPEKSKQSRRCLHYVVVKGHLFSRDKVTLCPLKTKAPSLSALAVYTDGKKKSRRNFAYIF